MLVAGRRAQAPSVEFLKACDAVDRHSGTEVHQWISDEEELCKAYRAELLQSSAGRFISVYVVVLH